MGVKRFIFLVAMVVGLLAFSNARKAGTADGSGGSKSHCCRNAKRNAMFMCMGHAGIKRIGRCKNLQKAARSFICQRDFICNK